MSKSLGNVIDPQTIVSQHGADVLRFWIASVDYRNDVRIGDNIIQQLVEVYKKVRNTCRFLLGNLYDFDPATDYVQYSELEEIDKYALHKLQILIGQITVHLITMNFTNTINSCKTLQLLILSSFYLDIVKDRLIYFRQKISSQEEPARLFCMRICRF